MALPATDSFAEPAFSPEYPASVAFVLRKVRQLRAEIGTQIDAIELEHEALKTRVAALEAVAPTPIVDKGEYTVAELNAMSKTANWLFHLSDSGTLTAGGISVRKGDTVLWSGTMWVTFGTGAPDLSHISIPSSSMSVGELKTAVKQLLAAFGRS